MSLLTRGGSLWATYGGRVMGRTQRRSLSTKSPFNNTPFRRLLVVVKHTAYEMYLQMKSQGKAPLALRWERLKNRHQAHKECVKDLSDLLTQLKVDYAMVGREELDPQHLKGVDLVVAVGGDGTALSASHFLDDSIPLLCINSDPSRDDEKSVSSKKTDERRSFGALCACTASDMFEVLPEILAGKRTPSRRARIQTIVKSTLKETRLPPALNDILIAHPNPAAVSRFRLWFTKQDNGEEVFSLNVWSSGMWISTATGSTAVMSACGGSVMNPESRELQYMVREHLVEAHHEHLRPAGHGMVEPGHTLHVRWSSQHGTIYVDGNHEQHDIGVRPSTSRDNTLFMQLGDQVRFTTDAPPVYLFAREQKTSGNWEK